jgi:hypothetical protein
MTHASAGDKMAWGDVSAFHTHATNVEKRGDIAVRACRPPKTANPHGCVQSSSSVVERQDRWHRLAMQKVDGSSPFIRFNDTRRIQASLSPRDKRLPGG